MPRAGFARSSFDRRLGEWPSSASSSSTPPAQARRRANSSGPEIGQAQRARRTASSSRPPSSLEIALASNGPPAASSATPGASYGLHHRSAIALVVAGERAFPGARARYRTCAFLAPHSRWFPSLAAGWSPASRSPCRGMGSIHKPSPIVFYVGRGHWRRQLLPRTSFPEWLASIGPSRRILYHDLTWGRGRWASCARFIKSSLRLGILRAVILTTTFRGAEPPSSASWSRRCRTPWGRARARRAGRSRWRGGARRRHRRPQARGAGVCASVVEERGGGCPDARQAARGVTAPIGGHEEPR